MVIPEILNWLALYEFERKITIKLEIILMKESG